MCIIFQAEVCENSLCEVLQCVVAGADGCILSFGQTSVGKWVILKSFSIL